jgi:hypothetical protein
LCCVAYCRRLYIGRTALVTNEVHALIVTGFVAAFMVRTDPVFLRIWATWFARMREVVAVAGEHDSFYDETGFGARSVSVREPRFVLGLVEIVHKQFDNRRIVFWQINFAFLVLLSYLINIHTKTIHVDCLAYLASRETFSSLKEARSSTYNCLVDVVRVAVTGDDEVGVLSRFENAVEC